MAIKKQKISEIVAQYPKHFMLKDKIAFHSDSQLELYLQKTRQLYADELIDENDGIKVIFQDKSWLHIRPSNTEPIIRIIAETDSLQKSQQLVEDFKKELQAI